MTITGDRIYKVAEIDLRWCCLEDDRPSSSGRSISFLPLFYDTRFLVVDSPYFEIIIGHPTLKDLNLYGRMNNIVCPFRSLPSNVATSSSVTAAQQSAADEERRRERLRTEQDELQRVRKPSDRELWGKLTTSRARHLQTNGKSW